MVSLLLDISEYVTCKFLFVSRKHHCLSLHCYHAFVTAELVEAVHASDHRLHVYTVNDEKQAADLFAMGVDALFTDYPERLLALAGE